MTKIVSHAQNFEDVILWRALKDVKSGLYIDIGAQDPVIDSVSFAFYEKGWRGIHVEPVPVYANLLRERRPDETVIQAAVSTHQGPLTFFEIPETGLSTADPEIAERHRKAGFKVCEASVPSLPLSEVFKQVGGQIHWLKIDVEGWEREVLASWRQSEARPWVVVVESTLPNTQQESFEAWEDLLLKRGYRFAYFDGLNRFYVHKSREELLSAFRTPPGFFDHFLLARETPYCAGLSREISTLDASLAQVRQQAEQLEQNLISQQNQRHLIEAERDQAKQWVDELTGELARRQAEHQASIGELDVMRQVLADERAALAEERERSRQHEAEGNTAKGRIEELAADLAHRQADNQALNDQLQEARQALADEQTSLAQDQERSRQEIQRLSRQLEDERGQAKHRVDELTGELARRQAEHQASIGELDVMRQVLADERAALAEERERSRQHEAEGNTAKGRIEELAADLTHRQADNQALNDQLQEARQALPASARAFLKRILRRGIAAIEARPGLKQSIVSGSHRPGWYPALRRLYHRITGQRVSTPAVEPASHAPGSVATGEAVTPWTRHMALRLEAARAGVEPGMK